MKNLETYINQSAPVGSLSCRIETNLKASTDFFVRLDEENQSEGIADDCCKENTSISMDSKQTRSNEYSATTFRTPSIRRSGKTMLDKYFKAMKTPRRPQGLDVDRFFVAETAINKLTRNSIDGGRPSLNTQLIDGERTMYKKTSLRDDKLFDRHLSIRKLPKII